MKDLTYSELVETLRSSNEPVIVVIEELYQNKKKVPFSDVRNSAVDDRECYLMMDALELLRKVLADVGYAPR